MCKYGKGISEFLLVFEDGHKRINKPQPTSVEVIKKAISNEKYGFF
jgi:hypothetical protein